MRCEADHIDIGQAQLRATHKLEEVMESAHNPDAEKSRHSQVSDVVGGFSLSGLWSDIKAPEIAADDLGDEAWSDVKIVTTAANDIDAKAVSKAAQGVATGLTDGVNFLGTTFNDVQGDACGATDLIFRAGVAFAGHGKSGLRHLEGQIDSDLEWQRKQGIDMEPWDNLNINVSNSIADPTSWQVTTNNVNTVYDVTPKGSHHADNITYIQSNEDLNRAVTTDANEDMHGSTVGLGYTNLSKDLPDQVYLLGGEDQMVFIQSEVAKDDGLVHFSCSKGVLEAVAAIPLSRLTASEVKEFGVDMKNWAQSSVKRVKSEYASNLAQSGTRFAELDQTELDQLKGDLTQAQIDTLENFGAAQGVGAFETLEESEKNPPPTPAPATPAASEPAAHAAPSTETHSRPSSGISFAGLTPQTPASSQPADHNPESSPQTPPAGDPAASTTQSPAASSAGNSAGSTAETHAAGTAETHAAGPAETHAAGAAETHAASTPREPSPAGTESAQPEGSGAGSGSSPQASTSGPTQNAGVAGSHSESPATHSQPASHSTSTAVGSHPAEPTVSSHPAAPTDSSHPASTDDSHPATPTGNTHPASPDTGESTPAARPGGTGTVPASSTSR